MKIAKILTHHDDKFINHIVGKKIKVEEYPYITSKYAILWWSTNKYEVVDGKLTKSDSEEAERICFFGDELEF